MSEEPTPNLNELIKKMNDAKTLEEFMGAYSKAQAENTDMYRFVETLDSLISAAKANLVRLYVECNLGNMSQDELKKMKEKGGKYAEVATIIENRQKKDKQKQQGQVNRADENQKKEDGKTSDSNEAQKTVSWFERISKKLKSCFKEVDSFLDKLLGKEEKKDEKPSDSTNQTSEEKSPMREGLNQGRLSYLSGRGPQEQQSPRTNDVQSRQQTNDAQPQQQTSMREIKRPGGRG